jgi:hypothetical protein
MIGDARQHVGEPGARIDFVQFGCDNPGGRGGRPRAAIYRHAPGASDGSSWTREESQVESCEHQNNANIHHQPFPESVSEEHEIYTDYDGRHRHHVKHHGYRSAHFSGNRHFEFSIT